MLLPTEVESSSRRILYNFPSHTSAACVEKKPPDSHVGDVVRRVLDSIRMRRNRMLTRHGRQSIEHAFLDLDRRFKSVCCSCWRCLSAPWSCSLSLRRLRFVPRRSRSRCTNSIATRPNRIKRENKSQREEKQRFLSLSKISDQYVVFIYFRTKDNSTPDAPPGSAGENKIETENGHARRAKFFIKILVWWQSDMRHLIQRLFSEARLE